MANSNRGFGTKISGREAQRIRSKKWVEKNRGRFNQNMRRQRKKNKNRRKLIAKEKERLEGLLEIKRKILQQ